MSWKPEVKVQGKWSANGLVFATEAEARDNASALRGRWYWLRDNASAQGRWFAVEDSRAVESDKPVNYRWTNGKLVHAEEGKDQ